MQRFTISKKEKEGASVTSEWSGLGLYFTNGVECLFRGAGGGKCPEGKHTTCSGGPTILLSQARFMGRENVFIKYFIL
jgi:hypothetical protein